MSRVYKFPRGAVFHFISKNCDAGSYFAPRKQVVIKTKPQNFYDKYCYDCEVRRKGECEGGYSILVNGECKEYKISEVTEPYSRLVNLAEHIYFYEIERESPYLYFPKEKSDGYQLVPFLIGNVYGDGSICFGDVNTYDYPNLEESYKAFWTSSFNGDLSGNSSDPLTWIEDWTPSRNWEKFRAGASEDDVSLYDTRVDLKFEDIITLPSYTWGFLYTHHAKNFIKQTAPIFELKNRYYAVLNEGVYEVDPDVDELYSYSKVTRNPPGLNSILKTIKEANQHLIKK